MLVSKFFRKLRNFLYYRYRDFFSRPINQCRRFDFPPENNGWKKHGDAPVWGNSETGTMFDPYVFFACNKFNMVASARKTKSLLLVESSDGVAWRNPKVILRGRPGMWDENVNRGCLLYVNGKSYLWYTGQNKEGACIGLAMSEDGKTFLRVGDNPVLKADAEFEGVSLMNPCVLWDESKGVFRMWYSAGETYEPDVICYAESKDGITWKKHEKPVLTKFAGHKWEQYKVGGCCVVKNENGDFEMYYIGYQNLDVARICVAKSYDGILWSRDENNLLLSPTRNAWDSDAVYKPSILKTGGKMYLWYNGRRSHEEYIGLAVKDLKSNA